MEKRNLKAKLNSARPFGFVHGLQSITLDNNFFVEFVLIIPYGRNSKFKKLVYAEGKTAVRCAKILIESACVHLQGKHVVCSYETKRPEYISDLGIFKIEDFSCEIKDNNKIKTIKDYYRELEKKYSVNNIQTAKKPKNKK